MALMSLLCSLTSKKFDFVFKHNLGLPRTAILCAALRISRLLPRFQHVGSHSISLNSYLRDMVIRVQNTSASARMFPSASERKFACQPLILDSQADLQHFPYLSEEYLSTKRDCSSTAEYPTCAIAAFGYPIPHGTLKSNHSYLFFANLFLRAFARANRCF